MELPILSKALDEQSWQNLQDLYPILADAVRQEVSDGHTPEQVRRCIMRHSGNTKLADWCASAARAHMAEAQGGAS